jgi:hypothetical protein
MQHMPHVNHSDRTVTIVSAVVLALATALVAWAAYQNNEWTRERFALSDNAVSLSQRAEDLRRASDSDDVRDRQLLIAWIDARATGALVRKHALESLFRDEFKPVFRRWLATDPLRRDGTLASSPFEYADYDVRVDRATAQRLLVESRRETERSEEAARRSSDYSFVTVVFAATLMFVGLANLFQQRSIRWMIAGISIALVIGGIAFLATLPVRTAL